MHKLSYGLVTLDACVARGSCVAELLQVTEVFVSTQAVLLLHQQQIMIIIMIMINTYDDVIFLYPAERAGMMSI